MLVCGLSCLRLFCRSKWYSLSGKRRLNCVASAQFGVEELKSRGVLRVAGDQVMQFMQGLITNDIKHLEQGASSMYTMLLNSKGRVMYDVIIYNDTKTPPALYIECDKNAVKALEKHLNMFKVKRKIDICRVDNCNVWVVFSPLNVVDVGKDVNIEETLQERVVPCQASGVEAHTNEQFEINNDLVTSFSQENMCASVDPRLATLGVRILSDDGTKVVNVADSKGIQVSDVYMSYRMLRYRLGIGEGSDELPFGKCFPLEMNCDYLHGISFHKGCYVGQELTARTHHTGVVRKRMMPIYLDSTVSESEVAVDSPIESVTQPSKAVGKLRGIEGNVAIGLLRISEALNASQLRIGRLTGYTVKPHWWPKEAPKDTASLSSKRE